MKKCLIACLLPVMAVVVFQAGPSHKRAVRDGISPVQKSMKLYDMEQRQVEMDRVVLQFRPTEPE